MRKFVPEKHAQISDRNIGIRRLTPEMIAFDAIGRCSEKKPKQEGFIFSGGTIPYL
jgi:hypothetical protein